MRVGRDGKKPFRNGSLRLCPGLLLRSELEAGLDFDFRDQEACPLVVPASRFPDPVLQGMGVFAFEDEPPAGLVAQVQGKAYAPSVKGCDRRSVQDIVFVGVNPGVIVLGVEQGGTEAELEAVSGQGEPEILHQQDSLLEVPAFHPAFPEEAGGELVGEIEA